MGFIEKKKKKKTTATTFLISKWQLSLAQLSDKARTKIRDTKTKIRMRKKKIS